MESTGMAVAFLDEHGWMRETREIAATISDRFAKKKLA